MKLRLPRRLLVKLFIDNFELSELTSWPMIKVIYTFFNKKEFDTILQANQGFEYCACVGNIDALKFAIQRTAPEKHHIYQCLLQSCMFNNIDIVKYICEHFDVDISSDKNYILRETCSSGHLNILIYLQKKYNLTTNIPSCLIRAAHNGNMEIVRWLCHHNKYDNDTLKKSIYFAQKYKYNYQALWLMSYKCGIDLENITEHDKYILIYYFSKKNKLWYLHKFFEFIKLTIDDRINTAFCLACRHNKIESAMFLVDKFPININTNDEYAFRKACKYGYNHLALWLDNLNKNINYSILNNYAIHRTCLNGYLDITLWLYPKLNKPFKWNYPIYPSNSDILFWLKWINTFY